MELRLGEHIREHEKIGLEDDIIALIGTYAVPPTRTLTHTQPAAGLTITPATSQDLSANRAWTYALANDLAALEGLSSTGIAVRTATDTWAQRTITGTSNRISVSSGNGVSGNPIVDIDAAYVGQTTITTLGTIATGVWSGTAIGPTFGGTGLTAYSQGDLIYASAPNTLITLPKNTTASRYLANTGLSNNPTWAQVNLANGVTGTLPVANGGTGIATLTANRIPYGNGTSAFQSSADLTFNGTTLTVGSSSTVPVLVANGIAQIGATNSQTAPGTGQIGLIVQWNASGGSGEVNLTNPFAYGGANNPGNGFFFMQRVDDLGSTWNPAVGGQSGNYAKIFQVGPYGINITPIIGLPSTSNVAAIQMSPIFNASSNSAARNWGVFGSVKATGSGNLTDSIGSLNGLEFNAQYDGTGTATKITGSLVYAANTNTGTVTTLVGGWDYALGNSGGGTVTNAYNHLVSGNLAITANSQIRAGLVFESAMPSAGVFTGTKRAQIWFNYNSTSAADGMWFGSSLDTGFYRGGSAVMNLTGSLVGTASGTFPTAVITPLIHPNDTGSSNLLVRGIDSTVGIAPATKVIVRGGRGDPFGDGDNGSGVEIYGGSADNGTAGDVRILKSNGTTKVIQVDDTGLGFFAATPVSQRSAYTISNDTTDRNYDANATTVDELADVVATLYRDLKSTGLFA